MLKGVQVWVSYVNAVKRGLNGHAVRLIVYDDGTDPARARAQTQKAIEQDHVIAFLLNANPFTGESTVSYINEKRVPVVGTAGGENWYYDSPMFFPQGATGAVYYETLPQGFIQYLRPKGKTKIGTLRCVESPSCDIEPQFAVEEGSLGYEYVYRGRASLATPDFTAECLAARNAGVEGLFFLMDNNSIPRFANSCARQGYRPIYGIPGQALDEAHRSVPSLEGSVAVHHVFAFFETGTPATDEFRRSMLSYGGKAPSSGGEATGWAAGKLMEKAGERLSEPPTTEALLRGLWGISNETLGGLTEPLTFTENRPAKRLACWFSMAIHKGTWVSLNSGKIDCR